MTQNKSHTLFNDFPPVTDEAWHEQVVRDLKGADYQKKLVWKTMEGFDLKPYYRASDISDKQYLETLKETLPQNSWRIRETIIASGADTCEKINAAIEGGAHEIVIMCNAQQDIAQLLGGIDPHKAVMMVHDNSGDMLNTANAVGQKYIMMHDPLTDLLTTGAFKTSEQEKFATAASLIKNTNGSCRIVVNGLHLRDAGASAHQELGMGLAMAVDFIEKMKDIVAPAEIIPCIEFHFGIGPDYFIEIAKLRAVRLLWARIAETYGVQNCIANIHSETSQWNKTIFDPHVNILRMTTEAMSAILGGTSSLYVHAFDATFNTESDFSTRIARNIQIVLKEEAYFGKVADSASGSYFIEQLTDTIMLQSWSLFLDVEKQGGYIASFSQGIIQSRIHEVANKKMQNIALGKDSLIGVNKYPDAAETARPRIKKEISLKKETKPVLSPSRAALELEALRLTTEAVRKPAVFLLTYGDPVMRSARAGFSRNFFACAGYDIISHTGYNSVEDGIAAALKSKAEIIVACSADDAYADSVPVIAEKVKDSALVVVAGAPACMDDLKAKGIQYFIHMRSNIVETLQQFHKALNIVK